MSLPPIHKSDLLQAYLDAGRIDAETADALRQQIPDTQHAEELLRRYGPVAGHMDGQSHPAIDDATPLYDLLYGTPFKSRRRRPGKMGRQAYSTQAMREAIAPGYLTTKGALRQRFGGTQTPQLDDAHTVDLRTRLTFFSPLNDMKVPGKEALAEGRPLRRGQERRLKKRQDKAWKRMDAQIASVRQFAASNPRFVLAKSALEARLLLNAKPDAMVLMTSVEGGAGIVHSQEDADSLRQRGVTHMTLVHLADDENGAAATVPGGGITARIVNAEGVGREKRGEDPGLSFHGHQALRWLTNAGVVLDLAHMSHETLDDALNWCERYGVAPIISHGFLEGQHKDFHGHRAISEDQLVRLYRLGGQLGMVLSGRAHGPDDVTMQGFLREYRRLVGVLHKPQNIQKILGLAAPTAYCDLTLKQRTQLSLAGGAGDFNAMRPAKPSNKTGELLVERHGLSDPGVVPSVLQMLVRDMGGDPNVLEPLLLGAERSLQISEQAAAHGAVYRVKALLEPLLAARTLPRDLRYLDCLRDPTGDARDVEALRQLYQAYCALEDVDLAHHQALYQACREIEELAAAALFRGRLFSAPALNP